MANPFDELHDDSNYFYKIFVLNIIIKSKISFIIAGESNHSRDFSNSNISNTLDFEFNSPSIPTHEQYQQELLALLNFESQNGNCSIYFNITYFVSSCLIFKDLSENCQLYV